MNCRHKILDISLFDKSWHDVYTYDFFKIPVADKVEVSENAANVALLRPSEQSSTFASKVANLAVDGNPGSAHEIYYVK